MLPVQKYKIHGVNLLMFNPKEYILSPIYKLIPNSNPSFLRDFILIQLTMIVVATVQKYRVLTFDLQPSKKLPIYKATASCNISVYLRDFILRQLTMLNIFVLVSVQKFRILTFDLQL